MMNDNQLCTAAWLLIGLTRSLPGILELKDGRLIFTSAEDGIGFDASIQEITSVNFPWHYFGAGLKLQLGAAEYKISFMEPNDSFGVPDNLTNQNENFTDLSGRKAGEAWKSLLLNHLKS